MEHANKVKMEINTPLERSSFSERYEIGQDDFSKRQDPSRSDSLYRSTEDEDTCILRRTTHGGTDQESREGSDENAATTENS